MENTERMKVVILCGGLGTRMKEETEFKPKPMVLVGGKPILWHIMKIYSHYGFRDFILCLGYKGEYIRDYFLKHQLMNHDFTMHLKEKDHTLHNKEPLEDWNITFVDTGPETETGGRIKLIEPYIKEDRFFLTYGDGVADININSLLEHHKLKGKIVTLTSIQPTSRFGVLEFDDNKTVVSFKEKPKLDGWISGGFFVCNKEIFDYLKVSDVFEQEPLRNLVKDNQLVAYPHEGSWECMDTFKDAQRLNEQWNTLNPFWKVWND